MRAEQTASPPTSKRKNARTKPWRPEQPFSRQDEWGYRIHTTQFDEIVAATDLCDAEETDAATQLLDQQLQAMQGVVARLANKLQRSCSRAEPQLGFDVEEGLLDTSRLPRIISIRRIRCRTSAKRT